MKRELLKKGLKSPEKILPFLRNRLQAKGLNAYRNPSIYYNSKKTLGMNVFEEDWDTLVILDSCRVDALREVAPEYDFLGDIGSRWSVGGQSSEWLANTFDKTHTSEIRETAYVTANPHSETVLENRLEQNWDGSSDPHTGRLQRYGSWDIADADELVAYEPLWQYNGDYEYPPRYVTDRGISVHERGDANRVILHYMPPHTPYLDRAIPDNSPSFAGSEMRYLNHTGDKDTVFEAYLNMLRWVLDDVELLLRNIDSEKVVLTADHGEAFGEYGVYYHHAGSLHPHIRQVPWAVTSATDTGSYTPSFAPEDVDETRRQTVEESLQALGYIEGEA